MATRGEPEKIKDIDSEYLSGKRQAYQEDISELEESTSPPPSIPDISNRAVPGLGWA